MKLQSIHFTGADWYGTARVSQLFMNLTDQKEIRRDSHRPMTLNFLGITGSNATFSWPDASGFMGLLPYTKSETNRYLNFIFQLRVQGIINHNVVAIYASNKENATIKFGNMDMEAILDSNIKNMRVFQTNAIDSWRLQANKWLLGNAQWDSKRQIDIDPALGYIYAPSGDWDILRDQIESMTQKCTDQYCKWEKNCAGVELNKLSRIQFYIIDPDADIYEVSVHFKHLLISGEQVGLSDNECVLGLFKSDEDAITWHFGTPFLENYYVVYDTSPYEKSHKDYITVGIAPLNPEFIGFEDGLKHNYTDVPISPDDQAFVPSETKTLEPSKPREEMNSEQQQQEKKHD